MTASKEYFSEYFVKNKERILKASADWAKRNPEKRKAISKRSKEKHKDHNAIVHKIWLEKNKERVRLKHKEWMQKNRESVNKKAVEYSKKRRLKDVNFKLKTSFRTAVARAIKFGAKKSCPSIVYLGCSIPMARKHIESKWKPGMKWENHGIHGWHIDHIVPISSFDFTKQSEVFEALHYTNLQPLWWNENLQKTNKTIQFEIPEIPDFRQKCEGMK